MCRAPLEHSPDTSSSWGDSGLLMNLSPLHFTAFYRTFPSLSLWDSWLLCWAQSQAVNPAFPASCSHRSALARTASHTNSCSQNIARATATCLMATPASQATCQERRRAAVSFVPTACLSSSTLRDSRVAPNSFCPEQREKELECNFKIREKWREKSPTIHQKIPTSSVSNPALVTFSKNGNGVEEALGSCPCLKENANHKKT